MNDVVRDGFEKIKTPAGGIGLPPLVADTMDRKKKADLLTFLRYIRDNGPDIEMDEAGFDPSNGVSFSSGFIGHLIMRLEELP